MSKAMLHRLLKSDFSNDMSATAAVPTSSIRLSVVIPTEPL